MQFIDLGAQRERLGDRLKAAIDRVVEGGKYILGPEVAEFEKPARRLCRRQACRRLRQRHRRAAAAALCGRHRAGRRGVRAELHLRRDRRSGGAGQGRAGVRRCRSRHLQYRHRQPRSGDRHGQARRTAAAEGDHPRRPVRARRRLRGDRDGSPKREGLLVIEDAAQSIGGTLGGRKCGSFGAVAGTSFYPAKPLGCYGDGGAMFTNDDELAAKLARSPSTARARRNTTTSMSA